MMVFSAPCTSENVVKDGKREILIDGDGNDANEDDDYLHMN